MPKKLLDAFKKTIDPETGKDLYDMGMIHDIKIEEKKVNMKVTVAFGCVGCGIIGMMLEDLENNIKEAGYEPDIEVG